MRQFKYKIRQLLQNLTFIAKCGGTMTKVLESSIFGGWYIQYMGRIELKYVFCCNNIKKCHSFIIRFIYLYKALLNQGKLNTSNNRARVKIIAYLQNTSKRVGQSRLGGC